MIKHMVRIVLHGAESSHYKILYESMLENGFSDVISGSSDVYELPDAEYASENANAKVVLALAKSAAWKTGCDFQVMVTPVGGKILTYGLRKRPTEIGALNAAVREILKRRR